MKLTYILSSVALICCSLFSSIVCKAEVHPLHWYAGMKNPSLQILIHEKNIGGSEVELKGAQGITITEVKSFSNPNYLIVYLNTKDAPAQKFTIKIKSSKVDLRSSSVAARDNSSKPGSPLATPSAQGFKGPKEITYELKSRNSHKVSSTGIDLEETHSWNSSDVVYLLMPDRFAKGYTDFQKKKMFSGMKEDTWNEEDFGRRGGDLKGMTDHLDYLQELGITAIWPTPLFVSDMDRESYHGYAITDYYQTDPRFGTNDDYRLWVEECHRRGIKVIQDIVFNHCGSNNFLFTDRPDDSWFHYNSQFTQTSYKTGAASDPHVSDRDNDLTVNGWFVKAMPDVNQGNRYFADYLIQASKWWVEYAGLDGIRQDTYPYNDFDFMARWCQEMEADFPGINIVGEAWMHNNVAVSYWQKDSKLNPKNTYLPTVMDFPLMELLNSVVDEETDSWDHGFARLYEYLSQDFVYADVNHLLTFLANHDTNRFQSDEAKGRNITRYKQALTLLLTLRGIPQLYYGDELGMVANKGMGDGGMRKIIPAECFTKEGRTALQNEYFDFTKKLLNWRKGNNIIAFGTMKHFAISDGTYVFARQYKGKTIVIMLNGTDREQTLDLAPYQEVLCSLTNSKSPYDIISETNITLNTTLTLQPRQILILQ